MTVACAIIATEARWPLVRDVILPSVLDQDFDEVVLVGDGESGDGYRHLFVPAITKTTLDALMKRECAAVATDADTIVYLCDDHRLHPSFLTILRTTYLRDMEWDALSPQRFCMRNGNACYLNMGEGEKYIGGHGIIVRRNLLREIPWMTAPHTPHWDKQQSHRWLAHGACLKWSASDLLIEDVEGKEPWL